jgi:tetratricopeptide (TPR) repeat protein
MGARADRVKVIEQAEKFVRGGRIREAIAEYERLALADPQDVGTLNIIGDLHIRVGQNDRAVHFFLKVADEYERRGLYSQALAICKKVHKLYPDDPDYALKLADLYAQQGFVAEAKAVYAAVAGRLTEEGKTPEAVVLYEKIVKLDREDHEARRLLAGLYRSLGNFDAALEQLNGSADVRVEKGQFEAAEEVLREALTVRPGDLRSLVGLVEVFKKRGQAGRAVELLEGEIVAAPDSVQLLNILGNIHFEAGDTKMAEEIFTRIVTGHPLNVNARIKLGRIQILKDKLDQAYELFEPLINNLVKKHRDEKAIGLLGLILESQRPHLPALERLALIYRSNKEVKKLEVVDRAILDELRKIGDKERMIGIYNELAELRPDDADLAQEARSLRQELGLVVEEVRDETPGLSDRDREAIKEVLDQADMYLQQGLVRIARRLLENLRFRYPEDPQIVRKIAVIDEVRTHMDEDEIRRRIEKTSLLEAQARERAAEKKAVGKRTEEKKPAAPADEEPKPETRRAKDAEPREEAPPPAAARPENGRPRAASPFKDDILEGEKVSTADIFAETDIIPFAGEEPVERRYYDLGPAAADELRWIAAARASQLRGEASPNERALSGIVAEFRKDLSTRGCAGDADMHYQLGLAFMGQGLITEAVEELTLAGEDRKLALESTTLISQCFRQQRNFGEAAKWLKTAMAEAKAGTEPYYALLYELAEVLEASGDRAGAGDLYQQISDWNPGFRNAAARLAELVKPAAG